MLLTGLTLFSYVTAAQLNKAGETADQDQMKSIPIASFLLFPHMLLSYSPVSKHLPNFSKDKLKLT